MYFKCCREKYYPTVKCTIRLFRSLEDWIQELERCGISAIDGGWRVLTADVRENNSLPMHFVVPRHMSDAEYKNNSRYFKGDRSAIWVWSIKNASLVRMSETSMHENSSYENTMMENVRRCDPSKKQPHLIDLTKKLPSPLDVLTGYMKLRNLCAPESDRVFLVS